MAAIFDLFPIRTSGILRSTSVVLPNLENVGIAVGISLLSCMEADIYVILYLLPVNGSHLWFLPYPHIWQSSRQFFVSPALKNMGIAVGISLLLCIVTELLLIPFFSRHLGFLTSGFIRQCFWWCHWKVYPMGVGTGIVFLSRQIAELLGGGNFTTPRLNAVRGPRSALQNSVRCPRVNL